MGADFLISGREIAFKRPHRPVPWLGMIAMRPIGRSRANFFLRTLPLLDSNRRTSATRPVAVPQAPLRAVRRYPCRLISMSYQRLSLSHGGGRGFESRRPAIHSKAVSNSPSTSPHPQFHPHVLLEASRFESHNIKIFLLSRDHLIEVFVRVQVERGLNANDPRCPAPSWGFPSPCSPANSKVVQTPAVPVRNYNPGLLRRWASECGRILMRRSELCHSFLTRGTRSQWILRRCGMSQPRNRALKSDKQ